jgi:hypothetical protein
MTEKYFLILMLYTGGPNMAMTTVPEPYTDIEDCTRAGIYWAGARTSDTSRADYVCLPKIPVLPKAPS